MNLQEFSRVTSDNKPIPLIEYLTGWASEKAFNRNAAGRVVKAIGEAEEIDTSKDPRLGRIFSNRTIHIYARFSQFYGIEEPIHKIVRYFKHAADGLEQSRQILLLEGPVGSGKSTLAELLKRLAEMEPVYVLAVREGEKIVPSPLFESPLGLFDKDRHGKQLEDRFQIPQRRLRVPMSRWAAQYLEQFGGDISQFVVTKVQPSIVTRTCVARVEPGDKKTDAGVLIGRAGKSGKFDDYAYTGGFSRTTQGLMEFVEIFKADKALLTPLLTATQDGKYAGEGDVGEIPYEGVVIAHSNETEFVAFKEGNSNPALVDRIFPVEVPYCLRTTEEERIYRTYLDQSGFKDIPCTPHALEIAARFAVATRIAEDEDFRDTRLRLYDGQPIEVRTGKDKDWTADDYRRTDDWREGMDGVSMRYMLKILPEIANTYPEEPGLDPITIIGMIERIARRDNLPAYNEKSVEDILIEDVTPRCEVIISQSIERAYYANYSAFATEKFNQYVACADAWLEKEDYKDPDSEQNLSRAEIETRLTKAEKDIETNDREKFRYKVVNDVLRHKGDAENCDKPVWTAIDELVWRKLERNFLATREEMLALISFEKKKDTKTQAAHDAFLVRLCDQGHTARQARRVVEWYMRHCK